MNTGPYRRRTLPVLGGGLAAIALGATLVAPPASAASTASARSEATAQCGGQAATPAQAKARKLNLTGKLPTTLRRGAKPKTISTAVHNPTRHTYRQVPLSISLFGQAKSADGVFLTAKDVRLEQYVAQHGWQRVTLRHGCDPALNATLRPAHGFTLRSGATHHTKLRIALNKQTPKKIKKVELLVATGSSAASGHRFQTIAVTG